MKVLLLSTSDTEGGAARATCRLHQGLRRSGVTAQILVQSNLSEDLTVVAPQSKIGKGIAKLRPTLDSLPLQLYPNRDRTKLISPQWLPDRLAKMVAQLCPDIVNLHWVCDGFLQLETVAKLNKSLVWTLHDLWPFTGGCHYNQDCDRFTKSCGACPQLDSHQRWDLSRWVWQRKAKTYRDLNLTIVTPSLWLAELASSSSLFKNLRVEVIPNGLDLTKFKPLDQRLAREILNLPQGKRLVLFGAIRAISDPRKGFHLLQSALQKLSSTEWGDRIELVVFGSSQPNNQPDLGFKTHYLGKLSDDATLALVYAAADVFVAPATQDNLPNTVMEALACGTPCVAFNTCGAPEMIEHLRNGYIVEPFEIEDFAQGIAWVLEDQDRYLRLCDHAHKKVEQEFTQDLQARRYLSLFNEILDLHNTGRDQHI